MPLLGQCTQYVCMKLQDNKLVKKASAGDVATLTTQTSSIVIISGDICNSSSHNLVDGHVEAFATTWEPWLLLSSIG